MTAEEWCNVSGNLASYLSLFEVTCFSFSEYIRFFPGAGWKIPKRPCWPTTSPVWQPWSSWYPLALWCSSWSIGRSASGMNGGRIVWLFSASGASAACLGQLGVWPSWTLGLSLTLSSFSSASSTLFKVWACGLLYTHRFQSVQIALGVYIVLLYSWGAWASVNLCGRFVLFLINKWPYHRTITTGERLAFSGIKRCHQTLYGIWSKNTGPKGKKGVKQTKTSNMYHRHLHVASLWTGLFSLLPHRLVAVYFEPVAHCISVGMRQWPWLIKAFCYWCLSEEKLFPLTCSVLVFDSSPKNATY